MDQFTNRLELVKQQLVLLSIIK